MIIRVFTLWKDEKKTHEYIFIIYLFEIFELSNQIYIKSLENSELKLNVSKSSNLEDEKEIHTTKEEETDQIESKI